MATITHTARMTADEFIADRSIPERAELVRGEVVLLTPPPMAHAIIARAIFRALDAHVSARGLGEVFFDGTGYKLPHRDDSVRLPDVSFVRGGRLPEVTALRGIPHLGPDLVAEVLSESDRRGVLHTKLEDYFGGGAQLVWLADPEERGVEVHAPRRPPRWFGEDGTLDGGDVLPEFSVPVAELFRGVARA